MADVAANGWELSDSDNEEDIFQLDIQASVNLEDDEPPTVSIKPPKSETRGGEDSSSSYQQQPSRHRRHERSVRTERNGDRHDRDSNPRRGGFFRRAGRADPDDQYVANDNGRSNPRYSMPFPTSAPFCAWFGNVASDIDNLEDELYEYFAQLDLEPKEIRFGNRASNNKTCCFVDFHAAEDLRHALKHIDSPDAPRFYDLKLHVDIAEPRPAPGGGGGRGRFGRGKRRSRHSAPMSVGNDEYHSHVNNRGRPAHSPPRRGGSASDYRRRGRGDRQGSQQHERRRRDSGPGTPRRPLSRISSEESSIHDEPDFDRRRDRDRDSFKVNGPIRDRYDGPPSLRSVRPSGPSRNRQRHDFDEAPRHTRSTPRQQRRANPRENWNHSKGRSGPASSRKSGGRPSGKAPRSRNSRFSNMFD